MPVRKNQLAEQVMRQLRRLIASGRFTVGERLPSEPQLMREFGVGRTTVREAVRVLAHSGLLEVRQGSGTYVRAASSSGDLVERLRNARVREVYQVRRALEVEVARAAAIARNEEDLATIRATLDRLHHNLNKGAREAFLEADMEMYAALAASTKNTVLIDFCRSFAQALKGALTQVMVFPGVMKSCVARHERVYQALVDGDPKLAQVATAQFLERVSSLIDDLLGNDSRISDPADGMTADGVNDLLDRSKSGT
jgi:GntR family transcriptional regulator, transcriptional repressor for pyruvate dehydrogenase complex